MRRRDGAAQEPDNLERLAALEAAIERHEPFRDFVFRVGNQAGQMRWCSISGEPRHDQAGAFLGYRGAGRDLTEQLEAQREVELQGLALQAILRATPDGVQLVDKSDGLLAVNDQIYEILDIPNRASQRDAGSTFQSILDLARRGEYGPGDPETLARERGVGAARDDRQPTRAHLRAPAHDRPLGRSRHRALDDGARLSLYRDITDAKVREAELERQSAVLSTITANMDGGIVVFDKDNRLVAWNSGFTDLIGVDPALARHGTTLREILVAQAKSGEFGPCDPEAEADRRIATYHGDRPLVSERTRPNGRIIELRRNPIPGGGSVTIYIDVTKRRQAEQALEELNATLERRIAERTEALAESERFQSTLLANVPGIVYRCRNDRDWTMEFVSEGCRVLLGLAPQDLVGGSTTYNELIHPDDREMVWQAVQRDFAADRPFELEYRVRHADGSYRWVWDRAHAIRVGDGQGRGDGGLRPRHHPAQGGRARAGPRARQSLRCRREHEPRHHAVRSRSPAGAASIARSSATISDRRTCSRSATSSRRTLRPPSSTATIPLAPGRTAAAFIAERLAKFERATGEVTERQMPDGRILHISDHRTLSGGTVSMGVDVTERVRMEQRLREVQRMESIGQLTGGLAHDFNNYLAVVIGNLDLLADCRYDDPEAPKLIEAALAGAQRGAELTRSLLAFSRRQPLNPRSLDVGQRVNDVARLLKRTIGEKITLDVQVARGLWPVEIDAAQLDSAIVNLANNARDAMPDGGTLTLAVRNAEAGPPSSRPAIMC